MTIYFIIVEPAVPENVGAAARAMKTMGFSSLRLVNPCEFKTGKATWVAHASGEVLDNAQVFPTLEEAVSDMDFVVASSAKTRSVRGDHHPAEDLPEMIRKKSGSISSVAIVFGREESGLRNDEMRLCNISTHIPMATTYPSLNLGQAVMLYAYILSGLNIELQDKKEKPVAESKFRVMLKQVADILQDTKLSENQNIYNRIFERLSLAEDTDINLLMSVMFTLNEKYQTMNPEKK